MWQHDCDGRLEQAVYMRLMTVTVLGRVSNLFQSILVSIIGLYRSPCRASSFNIDCVREYVSRHASSTLQEKTR